MIVRENVEKLHATSTARSVMASFVIHVVRVQAGDFFFLKCVYNYAPER